ncbi:hypothetical protein [Stenotrophomonas sp.]|uniref:hypothetical protein n=1 Tax=Stenotrophomonas sp. TaxID=69392 RepID=UPI002FC808B0
MNKGPAMPGLSRLRGASTRGVDALRPEHDAISYRTDDLVLLRYAKQRRRHAVANVPDEMRAKSPLLQAIYDSAVGLHAHGIIDTPRLKVYEELCIGPDPKRRSAHSNASPAAKARHD